MKYLITFSYDGSKFKGYQKQPRLRTVQSEIEKVLKQINNNKKVDLSASGRTDTGVHALNQKAHFSLDVKITYPDKLKMALNSMLEKDIYIKELVEIDEDFHARFDVKSKTYIYKINIGEFNPIEKDYVLQYCKKLDLDEVSRGLRYFEGTHNFKSFTKSDPKIEDYERTIISTDLKKDNNIITLEFTGTGFMRYMVRNLVGTLLEVGSCKIRSEEIISILNKEDRTKAGITAPACGLYLKDVYYK